MNPVIQLRIKEVPKVIFMSSENMSYEELGAYLKGIGLTPIDLLNGGYQYTCIEVHRMEGRAGNTQYIIKRPDGEVFVPPFAHIDEPYRKMIEFLKEC